MFEALQTENLYDFRGFIQLIVKFWPGEHFIRNIERILPSDICLKTAFKNPSIRQMEALRTIDI
jgi:hypothetical protein